MNLILIGNQVSDIRATVVFLLVHWRRHSIFENCFTTTCISNC